VNPSEETPVWQPGQPKLLDRVRDRCRVRHLSLSTEHAYVGWIRRFILFHNKRHPLQMGAAEVSAFLTHLAVDGHVAASTQNQALSALLFLYREVLEQDFGWLDDVVRAKKPKRLPVVFSPEEAMAVIGQLQGIRWLMGLQLYGGGLRLMECLRLREKDLDFERLQVTVREGKGDKDRVTLLPEAIVAPLREHLALRPTGTRARVAGWIRRRRVALCTGSKVPPRGPCNLRAAPFQAGITCDWAATRGAPTRSWERNSQS